MDTTIPDDVIGPGECIELSAKNLRGSGKPFVARITGTHPKFKFEREFLPNPFKAYEPGLYQARDTDSNMRRDKVYTTDSYLHIDADRKFRWVDEAEAYRIARSLR